MEVVLQFASSAKEEKNPHMQSIEIDINDVHLWFTSFN